MIRLFHVDSRYVCECIFNRLGVKEIEQDIQVSIPFLTLNEYTLQMSVFGCDPWLFLSLFVCLLVYFAISLSYNFWFEFYSLLQNWEILWGSLTVSAKARSVLYCVSSCSIMNCHCGQSWVQCDTWVVYLWTAQGRQLYISREEQASVSCLGSVWCMSCV